MPALRIRGIDIHLADSGPPHAPVVLLLHSTGLSGAQWRRLSRAIAATHRVLAPDLIGYGKSGPWRGPGPFVTSADLELVLAAMDLSSEPVHLVGHSYGGRLALLAAAEAPARVRSLCCYEPVAFGVLRSCGDHAALAELHAYDTSGRFIDDAFGGSEAWLEAFVDYWSGAGAWRAMDPALQAEFRRSSRKMFEEVRETTLDAVPHDHYSVIDAPTLLISGGASTLAGRSCCRHLAQVLPRARHVELADAGHLAPVQDSRRVNPLVVDHLRARSQPEPSAPRAVEA